MARPMPATAPKTHHMAGRLLYDISESVVLCTA